MKIYIKLILIGLLMMAGCSKTEKEKVFLEKIEIPETLSIQAGQSKQMPLKTFPGGVTEKYTIVWESSNEEVATVDKKGNLNTMKEGITTVTAYEQDFQRIKSKCKVTVTKKPIEIQRVSFKNAPATLIERSTVDLVVETAPDNINQPYTLVYSSSDKEVAMVSALGKLTALKKGTTTISVGVKDNPKIKADFKLTVTARAHPITGIAFKNAPITLIAGEEVDLTVEITPRQTDEPYELVFSSSNSSVAKVSETGRLTALEMGEATIGVVLKDRPEINATFTLVVKSPLYRYQLPNSDFEQWINVGTSKVNIDPTPVERNNYWCTANNFFVQGTHPVDGPNGLCAEMVTKKVDFVYRTIAAGAVFTGNFSTYINLDNPKQMTFFGSRFVQRPKSMTFKMSYKAGDQLQKVENGKFVDVTGKDQGQAWIELLEGYGDYHGEPVNGVKVLGRGELTIDDTNGWIEVTVPINYTDMITPPTHIAIVFTSSIRGDYLEGAAGSTLLVDDVRLNY